MSGVPTTNVRTDHALSIKVGNVTIGMIHDWSPAMTRQVNHAYEINSATSGGVRENIPGVISGLTISVVRYDLYATKMEKAWGPGFSIVMLTDQMNPLTITEKWSEPDTTEYWVYQGCWFTSLGRTHSAEGDRITKVNASLIYQTKNLVLERSGINKNLIHYFKKGYF